MCHSNAEPFTAPVQRPINLALSKSAWHGLTLSGQVASRAVDGNTAGTCTLAGTPPPGTAGAWLAIDLGASVPVNYVRIWNTQSNGSGEWPLVSSVRIWNTRSNESGQCKLDSLTLTHPQGLTHSTLRSYLTHFQDPILFTPRTLSHSLPKPYLIHPQDPISLTSRTLSYSLPGPYLTHDWDRNTHSSSGYACEMLTRH